jgi:hypothetical protein
MDSNFVSSKKSEAFRLKAATANHIAPRSFPLPQIVGQAAHYPFPHLLSSVKNLACFLALLYSLIGSMNALMRVEILADGFSSGSPGLAGCPALNGKQRQSIGFSAKLDLDSNQLEDIAFFEFICDI